MFKNLIGIFARAQELRNDPLLADIYDLPIEIDGSRYCNTSRKERSYYIGVENDLENIRKDKENFAKDFGNAFKAAKIRLGV